MTPPRRFLAALVVVLAMLVGACATTNATGSSGSNSSTPPPSSPAASRSSAPGSGTTSPGAEPVTGPTWVLVQTVSPSGPTAVPAGVRASLTIDGTDAKIEFGCNGGGGTVTLTATTMSFGSVVHTMMACGHPKDSVEQAMEHTLAATVGYTVSGSRLTLTRDDHTGLVFQTGASVATSGATTGDPTSSTMPAALVGTWTAVTARTADGISRSAAEPTTMAIGATGEVTLQTCDSSGSAVVAAHGATLTFTHVSAPARPCVYSQIGPECAYMKPPCTTIAPSDTPFSIDFATFLVGPVSFTVSGQVLTLTGGAGLVLTLSRTG